MEEKSDLKLAIDLAVQKRDERIEDLVEKLKEGSTKKEYLHDFIDGIASMNETISTMEAALVAVRVYRANNK